MGRTHEDAGGPLLGSHLSIAGDMRNALREAVSLGLDTVQVFTKNQRQWRVTPLDDERVAGWLADLDELGWGRGAPDGGRVVAHDSYLINLASPDDELWAKSIDLMRHELERAETLGIRALVSHPGAHVGSGLDAGLDRIAEAYRRLFASTRGSGVVLCLENTAGGGSTIGRTFEELADLRARIVEATGEPDRVGFCFDTCHALAAGYDLASHANGDGTGKRRTVADGRELGDEVLDEFDAVCGLAHLRVVHLNDSVGARGSRRDRHEHIGKGNVASGVFGAVLDRPELAGRPMILETPKGEDEQGRPHDTLNLRRLRRLRRSPAPIG